MGEKQAYPYVFQSGSYKGLSVEQVFLLDPIYVARIYQNSFKHKNSIKTPNQLQLAIESLIEKIKALEVTKICQYCEQEKITHFLLPDFGIISDRLLCCNNPACKKELKSARVGNLHSISDFMLMVSYMPRQQAQKIVNIFKKTHKNYQEAFAS